MTGYCSFESAQGNHRVGLSGVEPNM